MENERFWTNSSSSGFNKWTSENRKCFDWYGIWTRFNIFDSSNNDSNQTPLHLAALEGHLDVVMLLIQQGANINSLNTSNETPLHYASRQGHLDIIEYLIKIGANIFQKTSNIIFWLFRFLLSISLLKKAILMLLSIVLKLVLILMIKPQENSNMIWLDSTPFSIQGWTFWYCEVSCGKGCRH